MPQEFRFGIIERHKECRASTAILTNDMKSFEAEMSHQADLIDSKDAE